MLGYRKRLFCAGPLAGRLLEGTSSSQACERALRVLVECSENNKLRCDFRQTFIGSIERLGLRTLEYPRRAKWESAIIYLKNGPHQASLPPGQHPIS